MTANFYSDVITKDPRFGSVARIDDAQLLEPVTRALVQEIVSAARGMGIDVIVWETYRSQTRQELLFDQHVTKLRRVGVHHYGLACDIVKVVGGEPSWKGDFSFLGQLARSANLIWGGDWGNPAVHHSFIDQYHIQRCAVSREPVLFAATWYPDARYNPYEDQVPVLFADVSDAIRREQYHALGFERDRARPSESADAPSLSVR